MRCFRHSEVDAVGICRACSKGICMECAADLGHSLACKDKHIHVAENLELLINTNIQVQRASTKNQYLMPAIYGFIGLTLILDSLLSSKSFGLPTLIGSASLIVSIIAFRINANAYRK